MARGRRIFSLGIRLAIAALVTIGLVAFCFELYLRQTGYLNAQPANYPCVAGDPVLNHLFQRNCEGVASAAALKTAKDVTYRTNELGFRGKTPAPGMKTAVVIGDSYTEGFGLAEDETFPFQLERALRKAGTNGWQVLNGGTLGYTPALYARYFERFFLVWRPELVLLNLDFTDFTDDPYYLQIAEYAASGEPVAFPGRDIFPSFLLPYVYSNRSALLRFLHAEVNQWGLAKLRDSAQPAMDQYISQGPKLISQADIDAHQQQGCAKALEAVARGVMELKRRVDAVGGKLLLHMYPPGYLVKTYESQPQSISFVRTWDQKRRTDFSWACGTGPEVVPVMKAFADRAGIPFFSSFPLVMERADKAELYFDRDAHWNAKGVAVVVDGLVPRLLPYFSGVKVKAR